MYFGVNIEILDSVVDQIKNSFLRFFSKPEKQFLVLTFFVLIVVGLIINISLSMIIKKNFIEDRKHAITEYLNNFTNQELTPEIFLATNYRDNKTTFENFFKKISHKEIIRIKVYSRDTTIIYSDEDRLIGEKFLDNNELLEALAGEIEIEILEPLSSENTYEKGYNQLMEIYIPIYLGNEKPLGVIEAYYKLDELNSQIRQIQIIIGTVIIFVFTVLFLGLYWIFRHASKQIDLAHQRESEKLQEITRLRDEFVFIAVHELRTPVTVIKGYISVIFKENTQLKKDLKEPLEQINNANNDLLALVNDLLEVSRSESGKLTINVSPQNIQEIVEGCLKELRPLAEQKKISINNQLTSELPLILADNTKLREVLFNLIGNAIKYNHEEGEISLSCELVNESLIMHVTDNGVGLSKEDKNHLFEKFWRSEKVKVSGTGLGLFITKELITRMNGKIWVESKEDQGSTFSFKLPIVKN